MAKQAHSKFFFIAIFLDLGNYDFGVFFLDWTYTSIQERGGWNWTPMEEVDEVDRAGDGITSMRENVARTVPNPLGGTCRREFKKFVSKMDRGDAAVFKALDTDIMSIMGCLANISESTYDSYTKAAKMMHHPVAIAVKPTTDDASQLYTVLSNGNNALDELDFQRNRYALLNASHERLQDLYVQLYHASMTVVVECGKICPAHADLLGDMLKVPLFNLLVDLPGFRLDLCPYRLYWFLCPP